MNTVTIVISKYKILITDLFVFLLVFIIPTISHILPIPVYLIDPMRILVFTTFLLTKNSSNTYILAFSIPIFSMLVTGHPIFFKSILIAIELSSNLFFLIFGLKKKIMPMSIKIILSIFMSKIIYYGMKFVLLSLGWLEGNLISTGIGFQLTTILGITLVFSVLFNKSFKISR